MEPWREELYHYGVRGMKWKNHKSALANAHREQAYNDRVYGAMEATYGRDFDRKSVNYAKQENRKAYAHETTARAIENGRPGSRVKRFDYSSSDSTKGKGLYRREKSGSNAGYASGKERQKDRKFRSSGTKKVSTKKRGALYVKRVLS